MKTNKRWKGRPPKIPDRVYAIRTTILGSTYNKLRELGEGYLNNGIEVAVEVVKANKHMEQGELEEIARGILRSVEVIEAKQFTATSELKRIACQIIDKTNQK